MQTPTHTLMAMAVLAKQNSRGRNLSILIGSLIPDLFIYVAWVWLTFVMGESQSRIWGEIYFDDPMQLWGAVFNSAPIYLLIGFFGLFARRKFWSQCLMIGATAALIHIAGDLPVHADDAHRHFWPFSDWRFFSPLSYWDRSYHARWVSLFEAGVGCVCVFVLWRRFPARWVKVVLSLLAVLYVVMAGGALIFG